MNFTTNYTNHTNLLSEIMDYEFVLVRRTEGTMVRG